MDAPTWNLSIQYIKGVGPKRAALFAKLDLHTLYDLLYFTPFRYEDRTLLPTLNHLRVGETQTIAGRLMALSLSASSVKRMQMTHATLSDPTGTLHAVWFNQPYLTNVLKLGDDLMLTGKVTHNAYQHMDEMINPEFEKIDAAEDQMHMGRIVPIYHETQGLTHRMLRTCIFHALIQYAALFVEMLPKALLEKYKLLPLAEAMVQLHFPAAGSDVSLWNRGKSPAHGRLAFQELFLMQVGLAMRKHQSVTKISGIAFDVTGTLRDTVIQRAPFALTQAQRRVMADIEKDMKCETPMNRLIEGDVGCGKTYVALMAATLAMENGWQVALMAPTEILVEQHGLAVAMYIAAIGRSLVILTRQTGEKEKREALHRIASGEVDLVIGTHALIEQAVQFKALGLVIVDEQHKFGVLQRAKLVQKGKTPDLLMMTATPIPRTLALTLYGELDVSTIDEMPPGRGTVRTQIFSSKRRHEVYTRIAQEIDKGHQAYMVCPLIEESEKSDLQAAKTLAAELSRGFFTNRRVGLLHGAMKRLEKEAVMREFHDGKIDVLVATTVVEVGIDVPNATIMAIEHAERFGLAQLHQLRGRIGRSIHPSLCLLIYEHLPKEARQRLSAMTRLSDGFKIAEEDLRMRGPGEFFGTRQSGVPRLHVADLVRDADWVELAREEAFNWIRQDPSLSHPQSAALYRDLQQRFGESLAALLSG